MGRMARGAVALLGTLGVQEVLGVKNGTGVLGTGGRRKWGAPPAAPVTPRALHTHGGRVKRTPHLKFPRGRSDHDANGWRGHRIEGNSAEQDSAGQCHHNATTAGNW